MSRGRTAGRCRHDGKTTFRTYWCLHRSIPERIEPAIFRDLRGGDAGCPSPTEGSNIMPRKGETMPTEQARKIAEARRLKAAPSEKRCPRCEQVKPASAFGCRSGSSNVSGFVLRSYCRDCYNQRRRAASAARPRKPRTPRPKVPPLQRFMAKVNKTEACWLWIGAVNAGGYGKFVVVKGESPVYVHRWGYEQFVGPIPDGLHIDHLCSVRNCVNPAHLEPVTPAENVHRAIRRAQAMAESS